MNNTESINEKIIQNMIEITDFDAPELDVYARLTEAQLLNKDHPEDGLFIAESPKVISRALDGGYEPVSVLVEKKQVLEDAETIAVLGKCGNVPVYTAEFEVLTKLTGFKLTRGMLCAMKRRRLPGLQEICNGCDRIAVLENVMNPTNVGAIFRSAAALHMDAVILTGGCSNPLYRRASRVSMGTVFQIPWTFVDNSVIWPEEGMKILRELGFKTAAMALKEDSASIDDPELMKEDSASIDDPELMKEDKLAVILGTEGDGLAPETIADCDYTVMIPMSHGVDSLNVAAASAVAFWQLGKR